MKLYFLVCDGGDGSSSVSWFKHYSRAEYLHNEEDDYRCSDSIDSITLPDDFDVNTLGISIDTGEGGESDDEDEEEDDD